MHPFRHAIYTHVTTHIKSLLPTAPATHAAQRLALCVRRPIIAITFIGSKINYQRKATHTTNGYFIIRLLLLL